MASAKPFCDLAKLTLLSLMPSMVAFFWNNPALIFFTSSDSSTTDKATFFASSAIFCASATFAFALLAVTSAFLYFLSSSSICLSDSPITSGNCSRLIFCIPFPE